MKNRQQRIDDARFKLQGVKIANEHLISQMTKQISEAEAELRQAEASFDVGEYVKVVERCNRGCCVEWEFEGKIIAREPGGDYRIMTKNGEQKAYGGDMERTNETKSTERKTQEAQVQGTSGQTIDDDRLSF